MSTGREDGVRPDSGSSLSSSRAVPLPLTRSASLSLINLAPAQVAARLAQGLETPQVPRPLTVAFMNMRNFVSVRDDPSAISAFAAMDQIYPDGVALQIARHLACLPPFPRVSGTDTVPLLLTRVPAGTRVFLLGGSPAVSAAAAARFSRLFPRARLAGAHHGYFPESDDDHVLASIEAVNPDVLLVGMGSPLQERWLARNRHRLTARLAICVGGLFHYWAGDLHRAPKTMRGFGLEWLWILAQQPSKWRVYSLDAACFSLAMMRLKRRIP